MSARAAKVTAKHQAAIPPIATVKAAPLTGEIIPADTGIEIYNPFRAQLAEFKKENASLVFDYASPKGNEAARSHIYKMRLAKGALDRCRKAEKQASLDYGRKVDAEAADIEKEIDEMIAVHENPIKELEQKEKDRIAALTARVNEIRMSHQLSSDLPSTAIAEILVRIKATVLDGSFAEMIAQAAIAKDEAVTSLEAQLEAAKTREANAAETKRMQDEAAEAARKAREERIASDAAAMERKRIEDEATAVKEADERRQADLEHRRAIHGEIIAAFALMGVSEELAKEIIIAIRTGKMPHVQINY